MTSPTQRTLAWCRERGWRVQVVERWQPQSKRRIDLFGFIDLVAIEPGKDSSASVILPGDEPRLVGIQSTSDNAGGNLAARLTKAKEQCGEALAEWLAAGGRIEFHGWGKRGPRGKPKRWRLRRLDHNGEDIP